MRTLSRGTICDGCGIVVKDNWVDGDEDEKCVYTINIARPMGGELVDVHFCRCCLRDRTGKLGQAVFSYGRVQDKFLCTADR